MPALVLKSIPESLHRRLKAAAACHRRSLTQEAIILLDQALSSPASGRSDAVLCEAQPPSGICGA
jgi:plasmid stability protein